VSIDVARLQASLNRFTNRWLEDVAPLIVDGERGFLTNRRIMTVKWYPERSEQLCFEICGRPICPGRCAGRASNHSKTQKPGGAVDVSDYARFGELMERIPYRPRIFNALGPADPAQFSSIGT
jgi:hypothetical protein